MKELAEKISNDYQKLKSLYVRYDDGDDCISLEGAKYRSNNNNATLAQVNYLMGLDNVVTRSRSNLMKGNKWFMSACINIAKDYPDTKFYVSI